MFKELVGCKILCGDLQTERIISDVIVNSKLSFPQSGHYVYDIQFEDGATEEGLNAPQLESIKKFVLNLND